MGRPARLKIDWSCSRAVAQRVTGSVKWFNIKDRYGFMNRDDARENNFAHQAGITWNNSQKKKRNAREGEIVEHDVVVCEEGPDAANATGPDREHVQGSSYTVDG